jgi:hypothetical protein
VKKSTRTQYIVISSFNESKDYGIHILEKYRVILGYMQKNHEVFSIQYFLDRKYELFKNETVHDNLELIIKTAFELGVTIGILKKLECSISCPQWFKDLETISYWQSQLRSSKFKNNIGATKQSTKDIYLYSLWMFNRWLVTNTFIINNVKLLKNHTFKHETEKVSFTNVEDLIKILEKPFSVSTDIIKIIKRYLTDPIHKGKKASTILLYKSAIASYFEKNDHPLIFKFDPKTIYDSENDPDKRRLTLNELMEMLTVGQPSITEKAVILCKFHRGLDSSTLVDRFNYEAWDQLVHYFGSKSYKSWNLDKCPIPIKLARIKTGYIHRGFLDRDAIAAIQNYLDYRHKKTGKRMQSNQPLFLNKYNYPINTEWVSDKFFKLAKRAGIQKPINDPESKTQQYKISSHEVRDLLKSTLLDSGCRADIADHVIGHTPKDSYEKQAMLYPDTLRQEYSKASDRLNLFTKFKSIISCPENIDSLRLELKEKIEDFTKYKAIQEEEDKKLQIFEALYQNHIKEMQKQNTEQTELIKKLTKKIEYLESRLQDNEFNPIRKIKEDHDTDYGK